MSYDKVTLKKIYIKTSGYCHICHKKLSFSNYSAIGEKGCWEVEHSHAKASGGKDHLNNYYPACILCNRNKSTYTTKTARAWHDKKRAPLSKINRKRAKRDNAIGGAVIGGVTGILLGPWGAVTGAVFGANIGYKKNPDKRK